MGLAFLKGMLFGFGLMLAMGPVFFTIIQTSLQRGFRSAVLVATGVMLSDVLYIALVAFGLSQFLDNEQFKVFLAVAGGLIMLSYGIVLFFRKAESKNFEELTVGGNSFKHLAKGWLINFLNPFVFVFWIGVAGIAHVDYGVVHINKLAFFLGIVSMVYSSDILKSYLANRLRSLITVRLISNLNKVLGIILIASGIWLFTIALEMKSTGILSSTPSGLFTF